MINALLGSLAGAILAIGYLPQIKTLYNSKSEKGVSLIFWFLISVSLEITLYNLFTHHAVWYVFIPQLINAIIALVILVWATCKKKGYILGSFMFVFICSLPCF